MGDTTMIFDRQAREDLAEFNRSVRAFGRSIVDLLAPVVTALARAIERVT